jgi:hypothetical protein
MIHNLPDWTHMIDKDKISSQITKWDNAPPAFFSSCLRMQQSELTMIIIEVLHYENKELQQSKTNGICHRWSSKSEHIQSSFKYLFPRLKNRSARSAKIICPLFLSILSLRYIWNHLVQGHPPLRILLWDKRTTNQGSLAMPFIDQWTNL